MNAAPLAALYLAGVVLAVAGPLVVAFLLAA